MIRVKNRTLTTLLVCLFIGTTALLFPKNNELKNESFHSRSPRNKKSFICVTEINQELTFIRNNESKKLYENIVLDLQYTPLETDDTLSTLVEIKCLRVQADLFDIHNKLAYLDTAINRSTDPLLEVFSELADSTIIMRTHQNGRIEIESGQNSYLIEFISAPLVLLPQTPIQKGSKWNGTTPLTTHTSRIISSTWECSDICESKISLKLRSTIHGNSHFKPEAHGNAKMLPEMSGDEHGTLILDRDSGEILKAHIHQNLTRSIITENSNGSQDTQLNIKSEIRINKVLS